MYRNENTKRIFEIGSKVKKLWDVKHVYHWYLFIMLRNRRLYLPRTSSIGSLKLRPFQLKSRCSIPSNPRLGAHVCRERMHFMESVNTIITVHRGRIRLASPGDN